MLHTSRIDRHLKIDDRLGDQTGDGGRPNVLSSRPPGREREFDRGTLHGSDMAPFRAGGAPSAQPDPTDLAETDRARRCPSPAAYPDRIAPPPAYGEPWRRGLRADAAAVQTRALARERSDTVLVPRRLRRGTGFAEYTRVAQTG